MMNNELHHYDQDEAKIKALYGDIIGMPHHVSSSHKKMSRTDRAAQFGAFAALTGHYDALAEKARYTEQQKCIGKDAEEILDGKLELLKANLDLHTIVKVVYFKPDEIKEGGAYLTITSVVEKLDDANLMLVLENGIIIKYSNIIDIDIHG